MGKSVERETPASRELLNALEGKYLVFEFTDSNREATDTFLLLYRVRNGKLEGFRTPWSSGSEMPEVLDDRTFTELTKLAASGVTEVITVEFEGNLGELELGEHDTLPGQFVDPEIGLEHWEELKPVYDWSYYADELKAIGITLQYLDLTNPH
jgi:hypothetical protein